jgi:hypothetical protein
MFSFCSPEVDGSLRSVAMRLKVEKDMKAHGFDSQITRDVDIWQSTFKQMMNSDCENRRIDCLSRIFLILKYGGFVYRTENSDNTSWCYWKDTQLPIATALSHGSRIMIQLPKAYHCSVKQKSIRHLLQMKTKVEEENEYDHSFWRWLITGSPTGDLSQFVTTATFGSDAVQEQKIVFKRLAATHSIHYYKPSMFNENITKEEITVIVLPDGSKKSKHIFEMKEKLGLNTRNSKVISTKDHMLYHHRHWGMNISCGGEGNTTDLSTTIKSNGEHGHVYMYYMAPSRTRNGGILVGVEGSEYGKTDQSGITHSINGSSPEIGVTGGLKWERLKRLGLEITPDKYDSMFVDLSDGWEFLIKKQFDIRILGETSE